jgi:hypothetical protein
MDAGVRPVRGRAGVAGVDAAGALVRGGLERSRPRVLRPVCGGGRRVRGRRHPVRGRRRRVHGRRHPARGERRSAGDSGLRSRGGRHRIVRSGRRVRGADPRRRPGGSRRSWRLHAAGSRRPLPGWTRVLRVRPRRRAGPSVVRSRGPSARRGGRDPPARARRAAAERHRSVAPARAGAAPGRARRRSPRLDPRTSAPPPSQRVTTPPDASRVRPRSTVFIEGGSPCSATVFCRCCCSRSPLSP